MRIIRSVAAVLAGLGFMAATVTVGMLVASSRARPRDAGGPIDVAAFSTFLFLNLVFCGIGGDSWRLARPRGLDRRRRTRTQRRWRQIVGRAWQLMPRWRCQRPASQDGILRRSASLRSPASCSVESCAPRQVRPSASRV